MILKKATDKSNTSVQIIELSLEAELKVVIIEIEHTSSPLESSDMANTQFILPLEPLSSLLSVHHALNFTTI
jgi:hypothetical protein